jgi:hypothetical protein
MNTHNPVHVPESLAFAAAVARIADLRRESASAEMRRSARLARSTPARWPAAVVIALRDSLRPGAPARPCPTC